MQSEEAERVAWEAVCLGVSPSARKGEKRERSSDGGRRAPVTSHRQPALLRGGDGLGWVSAMLLQKATPPGSKHAHTCSASSIARCAMRRRCARRAAASAADLASAAATYVIATRTLLSGESRSSLVAKAGGVAAKS